MRRFVAHLGAISLSADQCIFPEAAAAGQEYHLSPSPSIIQLTRPTVASLRYGVLNAVAERTDLRHLRHHDGDWGVHTAHGGVGEREECGDWVR